MCERSVLSPIVVKAIVLLHTMPIAFVESHLTCLTHLYSSVVNHLWLKLHFPGILLQNQRQHNVSTPYCQASSMWYAQEHYNSYTQPLINLVSAHTVACAWPCVFLHNSSQFFFCKVKTKEHDNLHNATLLRLFRFYVGENSRTFQVLILNSRISQGFFGIEDFSRTYYKIQGLFKTVRTMSQTQYAQTDPKIIESRQFQNFEREAFIDDIKETLFHLASLLDDPNKMLEVWKLPINMPR